MSRTVAVHPVELPARPEDDAAAVGEPVHVGIDPGDRPGLLHVEIERAVDHPLAARCEVFHPQLRNILVAPHEGERLAVGRGGGAHRAAIAADRRGDFTSGEVMALDREDARVRILRVFEDRAGRGVAGVVDRRAVGSEHRLAQFLLEPFIGALDHLHPAAAADVVEPDLAGAGAAFGGEVLLGGNEAPVGRPVGLVEQAEILLGHLPLVAAVDIHHPDIVPAAAIRGEGDAGAIGREARLHLPRETFRDPLGRAAADRHGVDVAEQSEGERLPVGRDVDIHPRALVGLDRHLLEHRTLGRFDAPAFVRLCGLALGLGHGRSGNAKSKGRGPGKQGGGEIAHGKSPSVGAGD